MKVNKFIGFLIKHECRTCFTDGEQKPLYLFEALKEGFLQGVHDKILYVYQDFFPPGYIEDGWQAQQ